MCKIAICDDDKEYREKIKTVIKTEGILSSNEIRFYEYESGKELLEDADILHDQIFMDMRMPGLDGNKTVSGEMNAALLLFPEGTIELANCFYRENLMEKYLAYCIEKILSFAIEHTKKDKIRILELGAGTGATTDRILKVLENSTKKIAYIYSDITKYFLNFAAQKYQGKEELEYKVINIDSNLSDQGIAEESVDIVIAAGMMNNAVNTDYSMRQIICSLVHGGIALIAEPVGENYELMLSQSFMMSRPTDAREVCNETFLKMEEWKEVFWGCGISERELVVVPSDTSPLAPLNQKLFIIRKE